MAENLEERTYTSHGDVVRPGHPAGQEERRHPAAQASGHGRRKTPAQKAAALERAAQREQYRLSREGRRQRTHAMCVLAGAIAAELRAEPAQAPWVLDVVQRRVTKTPDHTAVLRWLSTI